MLGFRDPYVIQTGSDSKDWRIVLGSGIDGQGGALLVYSSQDLTSGVLVNVSEGGINHINCRCLCLWDLDSYIAMQPTCIGRIFKSWCHDLL